MFLNIILTILTVVLITITVLLTIWWRKYGKDLFSSISKMKGLTQNSSIFNEVSQGQNINDLMERLKKINDMFGGLKR